MASASYARKGIMVGKMSLGRESRGKGRTREKGAHCETAHEKPVIETTSVALPTLETNLPTETQPTKMQLVSSIRSTFIKKPTRQKKSREEGGRNTYKVATIHKAKRK
jgi:hypothetical protein